MKELLFNEVSLEPFCNNEYALLEKFLLILETLKYANENFGCSHIVFPDEIGKEKVLSSKSFYEWVYNLPKQSDKNRILAIIKRPFVVETLFSNTDALNKYYITVPSLDITERYCSGLATAFVKDQLSVSLQTSKIWTEHSITINEILNEDFENREVRVTNITSPKDFEHEIITNFIEKYSEIELLEDDTNPGDKPLSLRDDHGNDVLKPFAIKLNKSKYIKGVINSLPWNSRHQKFVKQVYSNGIAEVVLHWDDRGIGLAVQTTGRNFRETSEILKKLQSDLDIK